MERVKGIEPSSARWQRAILPLNHTRKNLKICPGRELNPQAVKHTHLKRTCLPVPPPGRKIQKSKRCGRESNPRMTVLQTAPLTTWVPHQRDKILQNLVT